MNEEERVLQDYQQEILDILRGQDDPAVKKERLEDYHANDMASCLPELTKEEREVFYSLLDMESLAEMMEYAEDAGQYLEEMDAQKAADILVKMEPDDAVDLLKETEPDIKKAWISRMPLENRKELQSLASYSEDLIGSRMTTNFVSLESNLNIREAMRSLIDQAAEHDNISTLYVVDENESYYGAVDLKDIIIARKDTKLEDITETAYPFVYADERIEDCLENIKAYSENSIPVLGEDKEILGVITAQDINEPVVDSVKKRLPWLIMLLFLGLLVSTVVGLFETVVAQLTIVMAFQSLILDMAGNVGTQSLAVTIRVLMDEQLKAGDKLKLLVKEMSIGGINGLVLGFFSLVGIGAYIYFFKHMPLHVSIGIAFCIGISLLLAMVISSFVGTIVPIFFKKIGVDPAAASGPLITTINDLVGVVSYYGLTWLLILEIMQIKVA